MTIAERAEHLKYMARLRSHIDPSRVRIGTEKLRQREMRRRTKRASVPVLQVASIAGVILAARWLFQKGREQQRARETQATTRSKASLQPG